VPLPLVTTIAATGVTDTGANVIGSINPQGLSGSWWFAYGTTPALGTTTATEPIGATSIPQTVTVTLTGLTTGDTYYAAVVGQTSAGTVTSAPVSFVAQTPATVTDASSPTTFTGTPAVAIPDYQFPIAFSPETGVAVVEQGSYEDIVSQVAAVVTCPQGACPELPTFGIPDVTFQPGPPDASGILSAIQRWVPSATEQVVVQALDNTGGSWGVSLTTQAAGTAQ
jgi:hypothetical protein